MLGQLIVYGFYIAVIFMVGREFIVPIDDDEREDR